MRSKFFFLFYFWKVISGVSGPRVPSVRVFFPLFFLYFFSRARKFEKAVYIEGKKYTWLPPILGREKYFLVAFKENSVRNFFFLNTNYLKKKRMQGLREFRRYDVCTLNWIIVKFKRLKSNYNKLCVLSDLNE